MKDENYGFWAMLELHPFKGSLTPKGRRAYQGEYLRRARFFVS